MIAEKTNEDRIAHHRNLQIKAASPNLARSEQVAAKVPSPAREPDFLKYSTARRKVPAAEDATNWAKGGNGFQFESERRKEIQLRREADLRA
jgi:hypothetical protein